MHDGSTGYGDPNVDVPLDAPARAGTGEAFGSIVARRLQRRSFLKAAVGAGAMVIGGGSVLGRDLLAPTAAGATTVGPLAGAAAAMLDDGLTFSPIAGSTADAVIVPDGYLADVLLRWGDSLFSDTPDLDPTQLVDGVLFEPGAADLQARRYGYNNDAVQWFALPAAPGADASAVLCINHEYTDDVLMFPGWAAPDGTPEPLPGEPTWRQAFHTAHPEAAGVILNAHGICAVVIDRVRGEWRVRKDSPLNVRLTGQSPFLLTGPAAGHRLLRTTADPLGRHVLGTLNNCAGGRTPWGTYLSAEENVDQYFGNADAYLASAAASAGVIEAHRRFPLPGGESERGLEHAQPRFDVAVEPTEALRFGWVVEYDPLRPDRAPRKRTAMGRFKHESATSTIAPSGQVVVYSGDDARFEYVYKFVTDGTFDATDRDANADLLDAGTLLVAVFHEDGTGEWRPLVHGRGPLTAANGFSSQADVVIKARHAADLLGATPMDRPEDIAINPVDGTVYVNLTNNTDREPVDGTADYGGRVVDLGVDTPNPRPDNAWGHTVELHEDGGDAAALAFAWDVFMLAGDPLAADGTYLTSMEDLDDLPVQTGSTYFAGWGDPSVVAPIGSPDNNQVDDRGNLWIVTDGSQPRGTNDGCFVAPTAGTDRGWLRQFASGPLDAEVCGLEFSPTFDALLLNIQHPGEDGTLAEPTSHWPDGGDSVPRPALVAVRRADGGRIGS